MSKVAANQQGSRGPTLAEERGLSWQGRPCGDCHQQDKERMQASRGGEELGEGHGQQRLP